MSVWEPVKEEGELPTRGLAWTEKRWGGRGGGRTMEKDVVVVVVVAVGEGG